MSANVILVNPSLSSNGEKYSEVVFPFAAVMLLATILDKSGYKVKVIDGNRYRINDCVQQLLKEINPDTLYIGFSVMTSQVKWAYRVTREIKKSCPLSRIVWGGTHPTLYPEKTISDEAIDIVVVNEACSSILALTKAIEAGTDLSAIPGIYYKSAADRPIATSKYIPDDFRNIPDVNFSLFDTAFYSQDNMLARLYNIPAHKVVSLPILTGLGCAYKCTFCINVILERKYRYKSAAEIVDRIEFLQKAYGANFFQFLDEDFFISRKRVFEFMDLVEKRALRFFFRPWLRVSYFRDNYISLEVAKRLEKIGMITAVMGAECGSQDVLDRIHKHIKVEDTLKAAETLSRTNIIPRFSMMVGLPGETERDILATYRLALRIRQINKRADIAILSFAAYPGSPIYNDAVKKYNLQEPSSLSEWAQADFSGYLGFYSVQGKPWITNKIIFDRMLEYYNFCFRFTHAKGIGHDFFLSVIRMLAQLRFKFGQFNFPFEEFLRKLYSLARRPLKGAI